MGDNNLKKYERFGKYLILDHLIDGGMATVCRARHLGEQANKMVAIKMVQPQYSNDENYVRMFQDELKITFSMSHPNIMQVYDYGKVNGQLYTAMEYIHGANLKDFNDRLKERNQIFPTHICCFIISQVCQGLHYAHTFKDKLTGRPYKIVHRDITPHNIMLTYDGSVKVIDFGIAKANTNSEATQVGTIKGKLSYLAPEYLEGFELDARYDEFAVGITLWEMLCSRKLFQAKNELSVLKQIQACKITPPSHINPNVPRELDEIVLKALSKDRNHRYENLDQMNRALVRFLYSNYPDFNPSDLETFSRKLFEDEISKDEKKFVEYGDIDIHPYIKQMKEEENKTQKIIKPGFQNKTLKTSQAQNRSEGPTEVRKKMRELELEINPIAMELEGEKKSLASVNKLKNTKVSSVNDLQESTRMTRSIAQSRKSLSSRSTKTFQASKSSSFEDETSSSHRPMLLFVAASIIGVLYFKADLTEKLFDFNLKKVIHGSGERVISSVPNGSVKQVNKQTSLIKIEPQKNKDSQVGKTFKPGGGKEGRILLGGVDIEMDIFINGEKYSFSGRPIRVVLNKEHEIVIKKRGYNPYRTTVYLTKENYSVFTKIPPLEKTRKGYLSSRKKYTSGSKLIFMEYGEKVEKNLPLENVEVAVGIYEGKIINPVLGTERNVLFTIEENVKSVLE